MKQPKVERVPPRKRRGAGRRAKEAPFVLTSNPLQGIPHEVLKEAILKMARNAADELPARLTLLDDLFRRVYPPHILCVFSAYALRIGVSSSGVVDRALLSGIEQHHIELLQALALRIPWEEWGREAATSSDFMVAKEAIADVANAFYQRRHLQTENVEDDADKARILLVEAIRMHTQMVRNWGYFSSVVRISHELYAPLDDALKKHHGFSATELFTVVRAAIDLVEARINERWEMLRKALRGKTPQRIVRQYFALSPDVKGNPEELVAEMPPGTTREAAQARMLEHADKFLPVRMVVLPEEIASVTGFDAHLCARALEVLAIKPGELANKEPEHIFLDNPVWTAPLINMDGAFLCVVPQTMFAFVHDILRKLAKEAGVEDALQKRRGTYLEDRARALLATALPGAKIWTNVKWSVGLDRYETDCVAKLDRTIVIVEAKSAALSSLGLRGHKDRLKRHVYELMQAPARQSARLEALIFAAKDGDAAAAASLAPFGNGFFEAERVVRLSVTLDDFSVISPMEGILKSAGWIDPAIDLPATINIADFECAVDLLGSPAIFVHYFSERSRIQKALEFVADELDFLGFYLHTGFNIWQIEEQKVRLMLSGASAPLDHYYQSRDAGVDTPKPSLRMSPYFKKLLWGIEERKRENWLTISVDLLYGLSFDEQKQLERMLDQLRRSVIKNRRDPDHECSVMVTPAPIREAALVFYVFPPELNEKRFDVMDVLISQTLQSSGRSRCVIVARNTARWDDPYRFVGLGFPGEEEGASEEDTPRAPDA